MVVLTAETCWALNEYWINNKISGIKLVSLNYKDDARSHKHKTQNLLQLLDLPPWRLSKYRTLQVKAVRRCGTSLTTSRGDDLWRHKESYQQYRWYKLKSLNIFTRLLTALSRYVWSWLKSTLQWRQSLWSAQSWVCNTRPAVTYANYGLFLSFRRVLNVNYSFLGNSPASEF